ncbi:MAG: CHRD domain-containing protein [Meiothermus sp.]|nr:CHRD domain-containing protein [Meiothermus sp.]
MKIWTQMAGMLMVLALAACSSGPKTTFAATLSGANERPSPVTTSATGSVTLALNEAAKSITVTGSYSGMVVDTSIAQTGAHIHGPIGKDGTAGVLFALTANNTGNTISGTFTVTDQQIADLRAGLWYVNLHSSTNRGGEIRGQLE